MESFTLSKLVDLGVTDIVIPDGVLVRWKDFKKYDPLQYDIIVRDCIQ